MVKKDPAAGQAVLTEEKAQRNISNNYPLFVTQVCKIIKIIAKILIIPLTAKKEGF